MEQVKKEHGKQDLDETEEVKAKDVKDQSIEDDVDSILDEIDDILEENAEVFVREYVQKGGE
jgi:ubiquitin-like protein Pup